MALPCLNTLIRSSICSTQLNPTQYPQDSIRCCGFPPNLVHLATVVAVYKFIQKPFAVTVVGHKTMQSCQIHCMHRQIPLACLGRSCIATVNALAYEESAHLQYFHHLSQSLPRFDRPESLLHSPKIPPWTALPSIASAARLRL